jgi:multicomponent Na+:H+ antiporter subunit F
VSSVAYFDLAQTLALAMVSIAFLVAVIRLMLGPTLVDRVLSLDMLVTSGIGFIAVIAIVTGYYQYLDVAIALGLVGFLATVAFARYVLVRGQKRGALDAGSALRSGKPTKPEDHE